MTSIEKNNKALKIKGKFHVKAFQKGGDPTKLSQVFKKDKNGTQYQSVCDFSNLKDCKAIISNILNYASNIFPSQINKLTG
jgi:hypothetical protein